MLLVEDDDQLRNVLQRALRRQGIDTIAAPSGLHALQLLREHSVDLVVTDQHMAGPSGLVVLEAVFREWPDVGRIILTGYVTEELRQSPAVDLVLDKGDTAGGLIAKIAEAARQRHEQRRG